MHTGRAWRPSRKVLVPLAATALMLGAAACGDDDDDTSAPVTEAEATDAPATDAPETTTAASGSAAAATAAPDSTAAVTTAAAGSTATTDATGSSAPDSTGEPASPPPPATTGEGEAVDVTVTDTSIELPTDLTAGLVDVTVTDETEAAGGEINFTLVEPGTDEASFSEGLLAVFDGGPFPDFFLNTAGAVGSATLALDEGEYIVWADLASNLDRPSTPEDIVTASITVAAGEDGAAIENADGTVDATDYSFAVDASAGGSILTFNNDSDSQFHHVILVDFGSNDPAVVEATLPELLASEEDAPPPEGLDMSQVNFEFASSGVFGPGGSGTFAAALEEGTTYAALCFIQDRAGGAPHAIQHQMFEVFQP